MCTEMEGTNWHKPDSLEVVKRPDFPTESFPPFLEGYIHRTAEKKQTPVDMPACIALAAYALACTGKFRVRGGDELVVNTNLYVAVSAETGTRKSAVYNKMMFPICFRRV